MAVHSDGEKPCGRLSLHLQRLPRGQDTVHLTEQDGNNFRGVCIVDAVSKCASSLADIQASSLSRGQASHSTSSVTSPLYTITGESFYTRRRTRAHFSKLGVDVCLARSWGGTLSLRTPSFVTLWCDLRPRGVSCGSPVERSPFALRNHLLQGQCGRSGAIFYVNVPTRQFHNTRRRVTHHSAAKRGPSVTPNPVRPRA